MTSAEIKNSIKEAFLKRDGASLFRIWYKLFYSDESISLDALPIKKHFYLWSAAISELLKECPKNGVLRALDSKTWITSDYLKEMYCTLIQHLTESEPEDKAEIVRVFFKTALGWNMDAVVKLASDAVKEGLSYYKALEEKAASLKS